MAPKFCAPYTIAIVWDTDDKKIESMTEEKVKNVNTDDEIKTSSFTNANKFENTDLASNSGGFNYACLNYESEFNKERRMIERNSHRYYCYLQRHLRGECGIELQSLSISNPDFDTFKITDGMYIDHMNAYGVPRRNKIHKDKIIYCISKMFGTFYTDPGRTCIYQCCTNDIHIDSMKRRHRHCFDEFLNGNQSYVYD